jgi:hypothetical protein
VFVGDIKSDVVNQKFMKFLEVSKQMIYNDDVKFGYIDLQKYFGRDFKLLNLEKVDQVVMFRRQNLKDQRIFEKSLWTIKDLKAWVGESVSLGPGPDMIRDLDLDLSMTLFKQKHPFLILLGSDESR